MRSPPSMKVAGVGSMSDCSMVTASPYFASAAAACCACELLTVTRTVFVVSSTNQPVMPATLAWRAPLGRRTVALEPSALPAALSSSATIASRSDWLRLTRRASAPAARAVSSWLASDTLTTSLPVLAS